MIMPVSLLSRHSGLIAQSNKDRQLSEGFFNSIETYKLFDDSEELFRILEIPDRTRSRRLEWLSGVICWKQIFIYNQSTWKYLSQVHKTFSVMLISGDDLRRVYPIVREVNRIFPDKSIVPVLSKCTASTSAALLQRGAADVLDSNMSQAEARARVHALVRRLDWRKDEWSRERDASARRDAKLAALAYDPLTPSEKRILEVLVECKSRVVSYYYLASCVTRRCDRPEKYKSLQVIVSRLRQKLVHDVHIKNLQGQGYVLYYKPAQISDAQIRSL